MNRLMKRLREPSSWAGAALAITGIGQLAQIREAPAVGEALDMTAGAIMGGMPWWQALILAVGGIYAAVKGEEGRD